RRAAEGAARALLGPGEARRPAYLRDLQHPPRGERGGHRRLPLPASRVQREAPLRAARARGCREGGFRGLPASRPPPPRNRWILRRRAGPRTQLIARTATPVRDP